MRVTICELPHEGEPLRSAWASLCEHTTLAQSDLVVLPELVFAPPVWEFEHFDSSVWAAVQAQCNLWLARLPELHARCVIGTRPATIDGKPFNEGFMWSLSSGFCSLRSKCFLPDEPGGWEARWFTPAGRVFPTYSAGSLKFGLNICTELWALDTYAEYAKQRVHAVVAPRATAAATTNKWLSVGTVAAVRSGAFCLSSNRVHPDGSCGGVGWIISPVGQLLGSTSPVAPFCTLEVDPAASVAASKTYPRYVFEASVS